MDATVGKIGVGMCTMPKASRMGRGDADKASDRNESDSPQPSSALPQGSIEGGAVAAPRGVGDDGSDGSSAGAHDD